MYYSHVYSISEIFRVYTVSMEVLASMAKAESLRKSAGNKFGPAEDEAKPSIPSWPKWVVRVATCC